MLPSSSRNHPQWWSNLAAGQLSLSILGIPEESWTLVHALDLLKMVIMEHCPSCLNSRVARPGMAMVRLVKFGLGEDGRMSSPSAKAFPARLLQERSLASTVSTWHTTAEAPASCHEIEGMLLRSYRTSSIIIDGAHSRVECFWGVIEHSARHWECLLFLCLLLLFEWDGDECVAVCDKNNDGFDLDLSFGWMRKWELPVCSVCLSLVIDILLINQVLLSSFWISASCHFGDVITTKCVCLEVIWWTVAMRDLSLVFSIYQAVRWSYVPEVC